MDKRRFDGLRERAPGLHRFLTSDDKPFPVLREVAVGAGIVLLVLGTLWGYTGQAIGDSPVVVVESGSMMHCKQPPGVATYGSTCTPTRYGRLGTIDPGDLILVKDVDSRSDVKTLGAGGDHHYGRSGDVIIFKPDGRTGTPVIHRALFWIQIESDGTFSVPEFGISHADDLNQPQLLELGLNRGYADDLRHMRLGPSDSGFVTRGDNNGQADQDANSSVATRPVKVAWILGVARGEIPWLGLVKLLANDLATGSTNFAQSGSDSKFLLFVTLAVLLGGPVVFEKYRTYRREQREGEGPDSP